MTTETNAGSAAISVEFGGKRAIIALVDRQSCILQRSETKTLWGRPAIPTLEPYVRAIETMFAFAVAEGYAVCGLGVSIPGTLDAAASRPLIVPTLPSLNGFPLREFLQTRFGLPVSLHVDVDAALLAEYQFHRDAKRLLFLNMNAVLGAALLIDGKLERTDAAYLGHTCHMPVVVGANGPRCGCGKRGCINTLISLDAIQKMVQRALRRDEESSLLLRLAGRETFGPHLLAEEAERGDRVALQVYAEICRWLGVALDKYISLLKPEKLILGGSILMASEALFDQLRSTLPTQCSLAGETVQIVPARLAEDAMLIGAALPLFSSTFPARASQSAQPEARANSQKQQKRRPRVPLHHADDASSDGIGRSAPLFADSFQSPQLGQGNA
ncbi:MAG TPA: ROK family protein [Ktedonobacteraceae bacterium]|nr:ROK family protein [Ktedonobacteraceae bacterium]